MTDYPNGRLPATILTTLEPGFVLRKTTAVAYRNLEKLARLQLDTRATPVDSYGCGYRDIAIMTVYYRASQGDLAAKRIAGIDPAMTISVAAPPNSSHAQGTRADIAFNGTVPNEAHLELAARCGWTREFGTDDRHHFAHDGRTFTVREEDKVRVLARYLNGRHLGRHTTADEDGKPGENFIWLLQAAGRADGIYPAPYRVDGDWEPTSRTRTYNVLYPHYWKVLWNG